MMVNVAAGSHQVSLVCPECGLGNPRNVLAPHSDLGSCDCGYKLPMVSGGHSGDGMLEISLEKSVIFSGRMIDAPERIDLRLLNY